MKKYRKAVHDPVHNIWLLQRRVLLFIWENISTGSEREIDEAIERLEKG